MGFEVYLISQIDTFLFLVAAYAVGCTVFHDLVVLLMRWVLAHHPGNSKYRSHSLVRLRRLFGAFQGTQCFVWRCVVKLCCLRRCFAFFGVPWHEESVGPDARM